MKMQLTYQNKTIKIKECTSFFDRFLGFMGQTNIKTGLLFNNCSSIHTFFMKENIDVIMLNNHNEILYYFPNLSKNKIILPKKNVTKTIELPPNYFNFNIHDKVIINN